MAGRRRRGGDADDRSGREHREHDRREPWDHPEEHHKIEQSRFEGGLPATPELYSLAREQWRRLPGAVMKPSMDPGVGDPAPGAPQPSGQPQSGGKGPEQ